MSLASLAAYASSDESDSEQEESISTPGPSASAAPVTSSVDLIEDEDDYQTSRSSVTSALPKAEGREDGVGGNIFQADDVVDDVPLADKIHAEKPKKSQKVKISIPSLSQFKDDGDEEPAAKKMKPASKGSGLFSLLPPPKTASTKQVGRALLPQAVSRPAPARRAAPAPARAPATEAAAADSDDEGGGDFFSLSEERVPLPSLPAAGPAAGPLTFSEREQQEAEAAAAAERRPPSPAPMDTAEQPSTTSAQWTAQPEQLDAKAAALQHLRGRRGQREAADIQFIDVNQDDILPDRDEWMTKHLTEEKVVRRPQKSADDPTNQQRRKHQITYLAHQAKEREVELKNEWAQNRATKNAYRTKYGF